MTQRNKLLLILGIVLFLAGIFLGGGVTYNHVKSRISDGIDTVYIPRIVEVPIEKPAEKFPVNSTTEIKKSDFIAETDSIVRVQNDSVVFRGYEPLSRISYVATVTGLNPKLTSLQIRTEERQITRTVQRPASGWTVSAFCDVGTTFQTLSLTSGISTGYTYGRFNVHFDVGIYNPDLSHIRNIQPYFGAGVKIDIYKKN